jgi:hypothetical protein
MVRDPAETSVLGYLSTCHTTTAFRSPPSLGNCTTVGITQRHPARLHTLEEGSLVGARARSSLNGARIGLRPASSGAGSVITGKDSPNSLIIARPRARDPHAVARAGNGDGEHAKFYAQRAAIVMVSEIG